MKLPFDTGQFFAVFARYNEAVWPAQVLLTGLAVIVALLVWHPSRARDRIISATLAGFWVWMGVVYQYGFFRAINPAATLFAAAFVAQAAALLWWGVFRRRLQFHVDRGMPGLAAGFLVAYALVAYPLVGQAAGHTYPAAPTFGLPCPTTIFTLGMLLAALPGLPRVLLAIPLAWTVVGTTAAVQLAVPQDLGLPVAAAVTVAFTFFVSKASSRQIPLATTRPV